MWLAAKWAAWLAILAAVVHVFYQVLTDANWSKQTVDWDAGWLAASGGLYLAGLAFPALFWWWCLRSLGQRAGWFATFRAYYVGGLGKYVPGKMMVIIMRTALVRGPAVRTGVAAVTVAYEGFTSMAAGAMLAALLVAWKFQSEEGRLWQALVLLAVALAPTLPWVFNPVVSRVARRFQKPDAEPLPPLRTGTLLGGFALNLVGWFFLGFSLWALVRGVYAEPYPVEEVLACTAYLCIAMVAGFFFVTPGGLGVREAILLLFFEPSLGPGLAFVVAMGLRLVWIIAELAAAGVLYPLPFVWSKTAHQVINSGGMIEESSRANQKGADP